MNVYFYNLRKLEEGTKVSSGASGYRIRYPMMYTQCSQFRKTEKVEVGIGIP